MNPCFPCPVSTCTCRCLTWSWARSFTFLRTRRRVDRLPRSCPTSSSTARPWNFLVENISHSALSLSLLFIFTYVSFPSLPRGFFPQRKVIYSLSKPFFHPLLFYPLSLSPFFLPCPSLIHSHVIFKRSNLSPCFLDFFHGKTFNISPTQDTHPDEESFAPPWER